MPTVELYFTDFTEDAQKRLLEAAGVKTPEEVNWDIYPVATLEFEEIEEG